MRTARVQDAWRRALEKERHFRLSGVHSTGKTPLGDLAHDLPNGLTVVCGLNGVGKTTFLRLLAAAIGAEGDGPGARADLLDVGEFAVNLVEDGREIELRVGDADASRPVTTLDAFRDCMTLLQLGQQPHFEDLTEGVEAYDYGAAELRTAEYVVGKRYEAIAVKEVEDPNREDAVLPAFAVRSSGTDYGFSSMGLGELAALMLLWRLTRIDAGTVVLVEEPETFLSSRATVALLDVLAETIHRRRLYAVVTTHSPGLAASVPLPAIRVLTSRGELSELRKPSSRAELELLLGSHAGLARAIVVEDSTAAIVVGELLGRYRGIWGRSVEILKTGSKDDVLAICKTFPVAERVRLVGVLDGNEEIPDEGSGWPLLRLPGPENPDLLLREAATADIDGLAASLNRDRDAVMATVETLSGADEHDWHAGVAQSLGLDVPAAVRASLSCWLKTQAHEFEANQLVDAIAAALSA